MTGARGAGKKLDELAGRCCGGAASRLSEEEARHLSEDLQVLAHPVRLQILDILAQRAGQVCVCDLEAALPVKQPTISHHLRILREAGLVGFERRGLWAYYYVQRAALAALRERLESRLAALD